MQFEAVTLAMAWGGQPALLAAIIMVRLVL
jgi:hypothetical protein